MKTISQQSRLLPLFERHNLPSFLIAFFPGLIACLFVGSLESIQTSHGLIIAPTQRNQTDAMFNHDCGCEPDNSQLDLAAPKSVIPLNVEDPGSLPRSVGTIRSFANRSLVSLKIRLQI